MVPDAGRNHDAPGSLAREHLASPRNFGRFDSSARGDIRSGEAGSRAAGSFVRFHLQVRGGVVAAARYEVLGPPALIAACSYMSVRLEGGAAEPAAVPAGLEAARALGLPRAEHGNALLVEDAVRAALASA